MDIIEKDEIEGVILKLQTIQRITRDTSAGLITQKCASDLRKLVLRDNYSKKVNHVVSV